jgi:hypothetical protein
VCVAFVAGTEEGHLWLTCQPRVLSTGRYELNDTTRHLQWREKKDHREVMIAAIRSRLVHGNLSTCGGKVNQS